MPFQSYASYFSLEELKAMRSAYAAALNDLSSQTLTVPPGKVPALKGKLAQLILASACNKKREADELKEIALRGLRTVRRGVGYSNAA
jgi:hypothetical protein